MRSKLIGSGNGKTYAIVFDEGDEVVSGLLEFAQHNGLAGSHFTAIGGFREAILGYFEPEKKDYKKIPLNEQVEVLSMVGDIASQKGEPKIHAHVVLGNSEGHTRGGHLVKAYV
ncbi:MAG: PPC domain-containing DNA-binding protein, partial [Terriglobia bacterium]